MEFSDKHRIRDFFGISFNLRLYAFVHKNLLGIHFSNYHFGNDLFLATLIKAYDEFATWKHNDVGNNTSNES